jgi:phosphate butyryltransferase
MKKLYDLVEKAKSQEKKRVVVIGAEDVEALKAVSMAEEEGFVEPVLVGKSEVIKAELEKMNKNYEIVDARDSYEAAEKGVRLVSSGTADVVLKGDIKTAILLKAVLNKEWGLRTGSVLSHVIAMETPHLEKLLFVTDGGMIVKPTLDEKVSIINNSVKIVKSIGVEVPKVAVLAAVEVVNPAMPETTEAAILTQMNRRGQISGCIVDGPLALDNALSEMAAKIKKVTGDVAGKADILVVPDIHSGNLLGKSAVYLAGGNIAGVIAGAAAPVVIVSRADNSQAKLASLALGVLSSK